MPWPRPPASTACAPSPSATAPSASARWPSTRSTARRPCAARAADRGRHCVAGAGHLQPRRALLAHPRTPPTTTPPPTPSRAWSACRWAPAGSPARPPPPISSASAPGSSRWCIGEAEILGQVRAALDASPGAGPFLRGVVHAALRAGRQARAETALGVGAQSVASAAVQLLGAGAAGRSQPRAGRRCRRHRREGGAPSARPRRRPTRGRQPHRRTRRRSSPPTLGAEPAGLDGLQDALGLAACGGLRRRRAPPTSSASTICAGRRRPATAAR